MKPFQKIAAHALVKKDGKYLVTRRSKINDYKPGVWDLPGGTIEIGETPERALNREMVEETSLKVKIVKPLFVCSGFQGGKRHQFWVVYECKYLEGEVRLNPEEHDEFKWASEEEIGKLSRIFFLDSFYKKFLI